MIGFILTGVGIAYLLSKSKKDTTIQPQQAQTNNTPVSNTQSNTVVSQLVKPNNTTVQQNTTTSSTSVAKPVKYWNEAESLVIAQRLLDAIKSKNLKDATTYLKVINNTINYVAVSPIFQRLTDKDFFSVASTIPTSLSKAFPTQSERDTWETVLTQIGLTKTSTGIWKV